MNDFIRITDRIDKIADSLRQEIKEINSMVTDIKVSVEVIKTDVKNLKILSSSIKNRILDIFVRIFSSTVLIGIGIVIERLIIR